MDANKFMREYKRMCASYGNCQNCPMREDNNGQCTEVPSRLSEEFTYKVTKVVEEWSAAQSVTTRADLFKKIYPSAATGLSGALFICPAMVDIHFRCEDETECVKCRKKYWLKEVQDGRC